MPFDDVFGEGMREELAEAPAAELDGLEPLEGFSVAFGAEVITVRLGEDRPDVFTRLGLAEVMPRTRPEFGVGYTRGVADPSTGRLGSTWATAPTPLSSRSGGTCRSRSAPTSDRRTPAPARATVAR